MKSGYKRCKVSRIKFTSWKSALVSSSFYVLVFCWHYTWFFKIEDHVFTQTYRTGSWLSPDLVTAFKEAHEQYKGRVGGLRAAQRGETELTRGNLHCVHRGRNGTRGGGPQERAPLSGQQRTSVFGGRWQQSGQMPGQSPHNWP